MYSDAGSQRKETRTSDCFRCHFTRIFDIWTQAYLILRHFPELCQLSKCDIYSKSFINENLDTYTYIISTMYLGRILLQNLQRLFITTNSMILYIHIPFLLCRGTIILLLYELMQSFLLKKVRGFVYISSSHLHEKGGTNRKKNHEKKNEAKLAFLGPLDWKKKSNLTFCWEKGFRSLISVYVEVEE